MKEYILSYDSNELKERYIYHSFEYRNYPIIKEYPFIYKRGSISLNTQYFKDLVAFSRRFTKSSLLLSIFSEDNNVVLNKKGIFLEDNVVTIKSKKVFNFIEYNNFFKIRKTLEKYHDQFMMHMTFKHYVNMFDNITVVPSSYIKLNRFENIHGKTKSFTNYFENFLIQELIPYRNLNLYENNMSSRDMLFDVFNNICESKLDNYNLYLNETINIKDEDYIANIIENYFVEEINDDILKLFNTDELFSIRNKLVNFYENIYSVPNIKIMNLFENDSLKKNDNKILSFYNTIDNGYKLYKDITLFTYDSFKNIINKDLYLLYSKAITPPELTLNLYNDYHTKKQISSDITLFNDTEHMLSMDDILLNIFDYYELILNEINAEIFDIGNFLEKDKHDLFISEGSIIDKSKYAHLFHVFGYDLVTKDKIPTFYNKENVFFSKAYKYGYSFDNIDFGKTNKHLYIIKQIKSLSKDFNRHLYNLKTGDHTIKIKKDLYLNRENNIISKSAILFRIINSGDISNKVKYDINLYNFFNGYIKTNKDLYLYKNNTDAYICKTSRNINRYSYINSLLKLKYDIARNEYTDHVYKISKDINFQLYNIFLKLSSKPIFINKENIGALKGYKLTNIEEYNINNIIKDLITINLYSSEKYGLVSFIKDSKFVFTEKMINSLYKKRKEVGDIFSFESTGSKIPADVLELDGLLCDSLGKNTVYNDFLNTSIIKQQLQTRYINNDLFINKRSKNVFDYTFNNITKKYHTAFEYKHESINKTIKNTNAENNFIYITKKDIFTDVFHLEFFTYTKFAFVSNEDTIFKLPKYIMEDNIINFDYYKNVFDGYNDVYGIRENPVHDMNSNDFIKNNNNQKYAFTKDAESILRKNLFPTFYTDPTYLNKDFITDYLPEFSGLKKIMAEVNIPTDDIVDWAWVYEEEDPFNDPFKIDELLLPENDTIYEDFENIIFNREKCVPRSPIRIIDKYTFIAKFPNHYPVKDEKGENAYKDIAIEYLDVRTSIMRRVFIGYYKLWQDNIFEFSRMTIPQSAKKMLDYLYAWITLNFGEDDILEALRTFRLIRWYLERGIIECSEYKITYEPDDLTSGRLSRSDDLKIPNDMFESIDGKPINNTMYIDTQNHVIRNNPNMLSQDAYVTFIIDNEKDTLISFDVNSMTPIKIILNEDTDYEQVLDTITLPTTGKMVYNIPYTGEINYFKIVRCSTDNNDNYFFIGNVVVKGMGHTGELNIEYEPKIQGNKLLNYVSKKVLAYTNLYEDNNKLFDDLIKGNVHIAEVYDKLVEYWNLHHENKDKGKRLTIKRT